MYRAGPYCHPGPSAVEAAVVEGENPVGRVLVVPRERTRRVGLFGNAALSWW